MVHAAAHAHATAHCQHYCLPGHFPHPRPRLRPCDDSNRNSAGAPSSGGSPLMQAKMPSHILTPSRSAYAMSNAQSVSPDKGPSPFCSFLANGSYTSTPKASSFALSTGSTCFFAVSLNPAERTERTDSSMTHNGPVFSKSHDGYRCSACS